MTVGSRVLILGANGMLGRELTDILSSRWDLTGADIGEVDITDRDGTMAFIGALNPDVVINAAAQTNVDGCESDPEGAFAVNAEGAAHVAAACSKSASRMVQISTDYVFDGLKGEPYFESDTPNPKSVYGRSKLTGEWAVEKALEEHIIVRTSWLFGAHGKNFVDTILNAASKRSVLEVVGDQYGSPTYVRDLAAAIGNLLMTDYCGIVNVTNSGVCSWCEYARTILQLAGVDGVSVNEITSDRLSRPAPRPTFSVLDGSRYAGLTGAPLRHWREAVGEYLIERVGVRRIS